MRSNSKDKCFTLELEVSHGLLWDIFNHARNFMEKMAKKTLMLPSTRCNHALLMQLELLQYVGEMIINFQRVIESNNGGVFLTMLLKINPKLLNVKIQYSIITFFTSPREFKPQSLVRIHAASVFLQMNSMTDHLFLFNFRHLLCQDRT